MKNFKKQLATATALALVAGVSAPVNVRAEGEIEETPIETIKAIELIEAEKLVKMENLVPASEVINAIELTEAIKATDMVEILKKAEKNTDGEKLVNSVDELKSALADSNVSTIRLAADTSYILDSTLNIDRPVEIIGSENTIIDGTNLLNGWIVKIEVGNVALRNLTVNSITTKYNSPVIKISNVGSDGATHISDIELENVNTEGWRGIDIYNADVRLKNCNFANMSDFIKSVVVNEGSKVDIINSTLTKGLNVKVTGETPAQIFIENLNSALSVSLEGKASLSNISLSDSLVMIKDDQDKFEVVKSDSPYVIIKDNEHGYKTLTAALNDVKNGDIITLHGNMSVSKSIELNNLSNITLDLNGYSIDSDVSFTKETDINNTWRDNLINVNDCIDVTIKNGSLNSKQNIEKENVIRNVLNSKNSTVTIEDVKLDHTNGYAGSPLMVNSSNVSLVGAIEFKTGDQSWYAVNVDQKTGNAILDLNAETELIFDEKNYLRLDNNASISLDSFGKFAEKELYSGIDDKDKRPFRIITLEKVTSIPWEPIGPSKPITPDVPYIPSRPSTPIVEGSETESGKKVDVEEVRTDKDVKEALGRENIITSVQIEDETDEPVEITVKVGKNHKEETVYVVQQNPETGELELVATAEVDKKGYVEFATESTEKLTLTTALPNGFIDTVATSEEPNVTYYVKDNKFVKGWLELEEGWYFFDYETSQKQSNKWIAEGKEWYKLDPNGVMYSSTWLAKDSTGEIWYYVNEKGAMVTNTIIDGYYINSLGQWKK